MAISLDDPISQIGLFISTFLIITGVCTYFGYGSDTYGIYLSFIGFMAMTAAILPDPIPIGELLNDINPDVIIDETIKLIKQITALDGVDVDVDAL